MRKSPQPATERAASTAPPGAHPRQCTMFAVDIAAFSQRDPDLQVHLRAALYAIIKNACDAAGVPWEHSHHEDRGDGIVLITSADTSIKIVLDSLIIHIRRHLHAHNKVASHAAQIRLRMAVHAGFVSFDTHGASGPAIIHLFRLLDAPTFKLRFAHHHGDYALIVSDYLYTEVVPCAAGLIEPASFHPIAVNIKETTCHAWIWLPDQTQHPGQQELPQQNHNSRRPWTIILFLQCNRLNP
jgi:hypothetical protein